MYTADQIFIVKHVGCASCDELAAALPDIESTIVGRGVAQTTELCKLAKKLTYKHNLTGRHTGYPFIVIGQTYILPRKLAIRVAASHVGLLVDLAKGLWRAMPYCRYEQAITDWMEVELETTLYHETRERLLEDMPFAAWLEVCEIARLFIQHGINKDRIIETIIRATLIEILGDA